MVKKNASVFISGEGSNLRSLIKNSRDYTFPIKIKLIVTDNKNAKGIKYAKKYSIPYLIFKNSLISEKMILNEHLKRNISIICLAGFMKILSRDFISNFKKKIVNIHPSILPKYKGLNTYKRVLKNKEKFTGSTVHYVNEKLDSGKLILSKKFFIEPDDNVETLTKKTKEIEHILFSKSLIKIFN